MNRFNELKGLLNPGEGGWGSRKIETSLDLSITKDDMKHFLQAYQNGTISYEQLLDWVNLVLFNDAFDFNGEDIRDVLDRIEESDEPGNELDDKTVGSLINSLQ